MAYKKEIEELGLNDAVSFALGRHDSATLDMENREQVHGYVYYPNYDPGLSEKGIASVTETCAKGLPGVSEWYTSRAERAWETTNRYCHDFQMAHIEDAFNPADYSGVPERVVDQYMVDFDDNALYAAYMETGAHLNDQKRAVQRLLELIKERDNKAELKAHRRLGIVSHDEICRLIMAWVLELPAEQFTNDECKIARGAFVVITFNPDGNVTMKRSKDVEGSVKDTTKVTFVITTVDPDGSTTVKRIEGIEIE